METNGHSYDTFTGANWTLPNNTLPNQSIDWYQPQPSTMPVYYSWPNYIAVEKEVEPKSCMGKAHVFECEHVASCKCGAIKRVMPKPKKART